MSYEPMYEHARAGAATSEEKKMKLEVPPEADVTINHLHTTAVEFKITAETLAAIRSRLSKAVGGAHAIQGWITAGDDNASKTNEGATTTTGEGKAMELLGAPLQIPQLQSLDMSRIYDVEKEISNCHDLAIPYELLQFLPSFKMDESARSMLIIRSPKVQAVVNAIHRKVTSTIALQQERAKRDASLQAQMMVRDLENKLETVATTELSRGYAIDPSTAMTGAVHRMAAPSLQCVYRLRSQIPAHHRLIRPHLIVVIHAQRYAVCEMQGSNSIYGSVFHESDLYDSRKLMPIDLGSVAQEQFHNFSKVSINWTCFQRPAS